MPQLLEMKGQRGLGNTQSFGQHPGIQAFGPGLNQRAKNGQPGFLRQRGETLRSG